MTDSDPLALLVRRWSKFGALSQDDEEAILALPYAHKKFAKGAYMVREGQRTSESSLMIRGLAFRQKTLSNGARQIISFHIPGEFVDLQNGLLGVADHNVQSLEGSETAIIPQAALFELSAQRPAIRLAMWTDTLIDASIFREWVVNVGRRDSRTRIAHLLYELAFRLRGIGQGDDLFDFPITQEQLADATGLTPVHTNRTLQALRKDGLIQLSARSLKILDWEGLKSAADFDELYLHQHIPHRSIDDR